MIKEDKEVFYVSQQVRHLSTSFGNIAVRDTGGAGLPVVLLHGAGASSAAFSRQFGSPLAETRRLIAIDLPGHGLSHVDPALAPRCTVPSVAGLVVDLIEQMGIDRALLAGWSMGGHIALETLFQRPDRLAGVLICGTPPLAHGSMAMLRAFQMNPLLLLLAKSDFSPRDARRLARMCFAPEANATHVQSLLESDGALRTALHRSLLNGDGADQKHLVETSPVPLAVVNGAADPVVRLSYVDKLRYANLWDDRCHVISGAGHAPFYTAPHAFNALLHRFAVDLDIRQTTPRLELERWQAIPA